MDLQKLVSTSSLKTGKLRKLEKDPHAHLSLRYDKIVDSLIILFVSPETETIAHFLDRHVALLYEARSKEIVGLQVENFQNGFLPLHSSVQKVWRLSEALKGQKLENLGEMILRIEEMKPRVVEEVVRASPSLRKKEFHFERLLANYDVSDV